MINVVDGVHLERDLFLTQQIIDTGVPAPVALNMMDEVEKKGLRIDTELLSRRNVGNGMNNLQVIIDADACPQACLQIVRRLEKEFAYVTITVASFNHRISNPRHLVVGNEPQATDMAVINLTRPGDIVITQDWGLAALVLAKQGRAIAPDGRIYESAQMSWMLEFRSESARFRRGGGRTKGPPKRTDSDNLRFEKGLIRLLKSKVN